MTRISLTVQRIAVVFLLALIGQLLNAHSNANSGDAGYYLGMAARMGSDGDGHPSFSLYQFDTPLRGYLFSLILLPLIGVQHFTHLPMIVLTKTFGCVWAAVLLGKLMPDYWQQLSGRKNQASWGTFIAFLGAFLLFWRDSLAYTFTDVPALTLLLGGALSLRRQTFGGWLLAGLCLAAAANFRPAYVITLPIMLALAAWLAWHGLSRRWLPMLGLGVGLALVWFPQVLINRHHFHQNTPLVLGQRDQAADKSGISNLYLWHLNAGIKVQKYGPTLIHPANFYTQVVSDPAGTVLLKYRGGKLIRSINEYIVYVAQHPADFLALYTRHLFNGFDIDSTSPWVLTNKPSGIWYYQLNYSLMFIGLLNLLRYGRHQKPWAWATLLALMAVVGVSIPIVMELRFALPLHLLLLAAATLFASPIVWNRWRRQHRSAFRSWMLVYVAWLLLAFTLHSYAEALSVWKAGYPVIEL